VSFFIVGYITDRHYYCWPRPVVMHIFLTRGGVESTTLWGVQEEKQGGRDTLIENPAQLMYLQVQLKESSCVCFFVI